MSTPADHGYAKCSRCGTQRRPEYCVGGACTDHEWCDAEAKRNDPATKRIAKLEAEVSFLREAGNSIWDTQARKDAAYWQREALLFLGQLRRAGIEPDELPLEVKP